VIILDAAVLVGYLDDSDQHHPATVQALTEYAHETFAVSALNLTETLVRPASRGQSDRAQQVLVGDLDITTVPILGTDAPRLAEIRALTALKMPDCCVLLAAERTGAWATVTFDARLRAATARHGLIALPRYLRRDP
jgi:predicted nucleic acid-binding protein